MPLVAVLEWDWALRSNLGFSRRAAVKAISRLLQTCGLVAEHHDPVVKALPIVATDNADFADALIAGRSQQAGCGSIKTFDRKAARNIAGMELFA
jgi:predicted nucleic-acid-binding protein